MSRGFTYEYEYIRIVERAKAMKALKEAQKLQEQRQKLVDEGKARWVKVPVSKGYKLIFEMLKE